MALVQKLVLIIRISILAPFVFDQVSRVESLRSRRRNYLVVFYSSRATSLVKLKEYGVERRRRRRRTGEERRRRAGKEEQRGGNERDAAYTLSFSRSFVSSLRMRVTYRESSREMRCDIIFQRLLFLPSVRSPVQHSNYVHTYAFTRLATFLCRKLHTYSCSFN